MNNLIESVTKTYSQFRVECGIVWGIFCCGLCSFLKWKESKKNRTPMTIKPWILIFVFTIYMVLLLDGTIFNRISRREYRIELMPFWSYWEVIVKRNMNIIGQMIYNILAFIPFGILIPSLYVKMRRATYVIGYAMIVSISIEATQLFLKLGLAELDDVFHNVIGAVLGYLVWNIYISLRGKVGENI